MKEKLTPEQEDLMAIREALEDMANGDQGKSLEEFDRDFRKQHGIPDDAK